MKKILMFNILLLCAVWSLPGVACTNGMSKPISCNDVGIANGSDCYSYCYNDREVNTVTACKPGFYLLDEIPRISGYFMRCGTLEDACRNARHSAGWNSYTNKCDCGGNDYEWSDEVRDCVHGADYEACTTSGSNAYWDRINGRCICNDSEKYWDELVHECKIKPDQAKCEDWKDNHNAGVEWNAVTQKCECKRDVAGNAIANPDDYQVDNLWRCVKKPSVAWVENARINEPVANARTEEIRGVLSELKSIIYKDMDTSHWKNASGGFNTARLASDSVAGVVLGTVGGVITSNVIKKNQVKGGFEDINCTVGGQRVAGYADEFNVGIQ